MDDILKFIGYWNAKLDDIVWEEKSRLICKYRNFFNYDKTNFRKTLKEAIS